ncbi:MAG TPA: PH domain-containing protein, partial [Cellulomonas sp.]
MSIQPAPVVPEAVGEEGYAWQRMHPVTPLLKGWKVLVAVLVIAGTQLTDDIRRAGDLLDGHGWLVVLGLFVVVALVALAWSFVSWRVTRFAVTDEAVHLRQGIVFRQQRQARLDRLQAVDVVQPLLGRLVGLSELRLEVAGGAGSRVSLAFLRESEADALRAELLALAAGLRRPGATAQREAGRPASEAGPGAPGGPGSTSGAGTTSGPGTTSGALAAAGAGASSTVGAGPTRPAIGRRGRGEPAFATAPEQAVYELPMPRLLGSLLRSGGTFWFLVLVVAIVVIVAVGAPAETIFSLLPVGFALVSFFWQRINGAATFRAATSPDGIRLRHGLTESRSQTLPPGRVQAVRLHQPLLWRGKDWWRVEVNVAGYSGDRDKQGTETVLHPVATRDEAMLALWLVLPDLGVDDPRAALAAGFDGTGEDGGYTAAPRRSRWVDPVGWRRHGVLVTRQALMLRSGRFWR